MTALYAAQGLPWQRRRRHRTPGMLPPESEKHFQQFVTDTMRLFGWQTYHTWNSRHSSAGFPDLIAVRNGRLLAIECKTDVGVVQPKQAMWLKLFSECASAESHVWRPSDRQRIVEILR